MQIGRLVKPLYFYARLVLDPTQLENVFHMRAAADDPRVTRAIYDRLAQEPDLREALAKRVRLGHFTISDLLGLPEGSLGREYGLFMQRHGLTPGAIPRIDDDGPLYVRAHLFETHDLWHVATGFGPDTEGETALQAVYAAQLPGMLPAALVSALLLNAAVERSGRKTKARFDAIARGWELGTRAKSLFGYPWQERFERPLAVVRKELQIDASLAVPRELRVVLDRDLSYEAFPT
jgi:ubiquinone biosynthesis protein COQ4